MNSQINKTLKGLMDVGSYNGWDGELIKIYLYILDHCTNKENDYFNIGIPDYLTQEYPNCNIYIRIFWSTIIMMYGCYGTSPRFGWLEPKDNDTELPFNNLLETFEQFAKESVKIKKEDLNIQVDNIYDEDYLYTKEVWTNWIFNRLTDGYLNYDHEKWDIRND